MALIGDGVLSGDDLGRDQVQHVDPDLGYILSNKSLLSELVVYDDREYGHGIPIGRALVDISSVADGIISHSYGDENLFWRVWFEPVEYDVGFITEDIPFDIKVWNAYLDTLIVITDISVLAQEGTIIDHNPIPINIQKFGDSTSEVTISRVGPPLQNTVYTFTIDAVEYTCTIIGMRIINWLLEPNWERDVNLELAFETSIAENRFFKEQRRYLREDPLRGIKLSAWAKGLDAQKTKQDLSYGHDKVFGIPIYSEPCYPTGTITGQTTINISNDITKYWNLNNLCTYVMIVDHDKLIGEVKEVSSVGASSVVLVRSVVQSFDVEATIVYPIFMATITSLTLRNETDDVIYFDLNFEEYGIG